MQKRANKYLVDGLLVDPRSGVVVDAGRGGLSRPGGKQWGHLPHESHEALGSVGVG